MDTGYEVDDGRNSDLFESALNLLKAARKAEQATPSGCELDSDRCISAPSLPEKRPDPGAGSEPSEVSRQGESMRCARASLTDVC